MKSRFKRNKKLTGLQAVCESNSLRGYEFICDNMAVGFISNASHSSLSKDDSEEWHVWLYSKGHNVHFKKTFKFEDIEGAKEYLKSAYTTIVEGDSPYCVEMKNKLTPINRYED